MNPNLNTKTIGIAVCALALAGRPFLSRAQTTTSPATQDTQTTTVSPPLPTPSSQEAQIAATPSTQSRQSSIPAQSGFRNEIGVEPLHGALGQSIDVKLKDATVQQAAEALSHASGLKIVADSSVPRDLRLTVEAQHVPLRSVLEGIGQQGELMIGRDGDTIVFKAWPMLNVNGKRTYYKGKFDPWGDEWGGRPGQLSLGGGFAGWTVGSGNLQGGGNFGGSQPFFGQGGGLGGGNSIPSSQAMIQPDIGFAFTPSPGLPAVAAITPGEYGPLFGSFHITALGDKLVIAEPGRDPQGEAGVTLTVYQWDNGRQELRKISSTFHRAAGGTRRMRAATPVAPGNKASALRIAPVPAVEAPVAPVPGAGGRSNTPAPTPVPGADEGDPEPDANDAPGPIKPVPPTPAPEDPGNPL